MGGKEGEVTFFHPNQVTALSCRVFANEEHPFGNQHQNRPFGQVGVGGIMRDIVYIVVIVAFYLVSIAYLKFCDKIR
jgi:hypothetical protein